MKRQFVLFFCLLIMPISLLANVIQNGGFENGTEHWGDFTPNEGPGENFFIVDEPVSEGTKAAQIGPGTYVGVEYDITDIANSCGNGDYKLALDFYMPADFGDAKIGAKIVYTDEADTAKNIWLTGINTSSDDTLTWVHKSGSKNIQFTGQVYNAVVRIYKWGTENLFFVDNISLVAPDAVTYKITATAGEHGSIDPQGEIEAFKGSDQVFSFMPTAGYKVDQILVDGIATGDSSYYQFKNILSDHTIDVSFAPKSPVLGTDFYKWPTEPGQTKLSTQYKVWLSTKGGEEVELQVVQSDAKWEGDYLDYYLKGRTFSFVNVSYDKLVGQGLTFRIEKLFGSDAASVDIAPQSYGIEPENFTGKQVEFSIDDNNKYISVNFVTGDNKVAVNRLGHNTIWIKHMLCIFIDPPETDVPNPLDDGVVSYRNDLPREELEKASTIYFPQGYHNMNDYQAKEDGQIIDADGCLYLRDNQSVYIPGGAFVEGLIDREKYQNINQKLYGRGIFSGRQYLWAHHPDAPFNDDPYHPDYHRQIVNLGDNAEINGLMIIESHHHGIVARRTRIENLKMLGWHCNNDLVRVGDGSEISNSFLRAVDDHFYNYNIHVHDVVLWAGHNGAIVTFGWASYETGASLLENIDIINPEWTGLGNNNGLIASQVDFDFKPQDYGTGSTMTIFRDIRIEGDIPGLTNLKSKVRDGSWASSKIPAADVGYVGDVILENITVNSQWGKGVLKGNSDPATDADTTFWVQNVHFKNVSIGGEPLTETNKTDYFDINAYTRNITFQSVFVDITEPLTGAFISQDSLLTVVVDAQSTTGIEKVEFYYDDSLLVTDDAVPFEAIYDCLQAGKRKISVKAYDSPDNFSADSVSINVFFPDDVLPEINFISPADSSSFIFSEPVELNVITTDNIGIIQQKIFFDNELICTIDTTDVDSLHYVQTFTEPAPGEHSIVVLVTDHAANVCVDSVRFAVADVLPLENWIGFYKFEENSADSSGLGNDGEIVGDPVFVNGMFGKALQFDGDGVDVPVTLGEDFSIAFWMNTTDSSAREIKVMDAGEESFSVVLKDCKIGLNISESDSLVLSHAQICVGAWTHIMITRHSATGMVNIYANGSLNGTGHAASGTKAASDGFRIGGAKSGGAFKGVLDEVYLFDAVLSAKAARKLSVHLPEPWISTDIGNPLVPGYAMEADSVFIVTGAGSDMWGDYDRFQYVYQPFSGDLTMVCQITHFDSLESFSMAGLMVRESLDPQSKEASMLLLGQGGYTFRERLEFAEDTGQSFNRKAEALNVRAPYWLKIERAGNTFNGYFSSDGQDWTLWYTAELEMPTNVFIGMAVCSHNTEESVTAKFAHVQIWDQVFETAVKDETVIVSTFALDANYPNPFNPVTTLQYQLPEVSHVKLEIYNLLGEKVLTLVDEEQYAGKHKVVWNAENAIGVTVSTGIYFYRLEARSASDTFSQVRKMVMIK